MTPQANLAFLLSILVTASCHKSKYIYICGIIGKIKSKQIVQVAK